MSDPDGRSGKKGEIASRRANMRVRLLVFGTVQGVGFRPFVYNLARRKGLVGSVRNAGGHVVIDAWGDEGVIAEFRRELITELPPLARITDLRMTQADWRLPVPAAFVIESSKESSAPERAVAPDAATCGDCLRELLDPADRRYRYPFINCTNCGPRFTIIEALPYDRGATTMARFQMCLLCRAEYEDPENRRFHAQPNACAACGPSCAFVVAAESAPARELARAEAAINAAVAALRRGDIIALKGLGGFHLVCDAAQADAVSRLRERKRRYAKPLAVMVKDVAMARQFCEVSAEEEAALLCSRRPIVLLRRRTECALPEVLAPGLDVLGLMLPYTPLHHLVLHDYDGPVVATSGNAADEPIAIDNDEALSRLAGIADCFLVHDRDICSRYDDSVARLFAGVEVMVRRSRGYAPLVVSLPFTSPQPILSCGAHLKNTFCLVRGDQAFVSPHIGDLDDVDTMESFHDTLARFQRLFAVAPELIACDLHPDYGSTSVARALSTELELPLIQVQHHHAHIAACAAEHGLMEPVIGVAFDGTGYGADGTAWGGEFLVVDGSRFERKGHFQPVPMLGGEAVVKQPWRMALGFVLEAGQDGADLFGPFLSALAERLGDGALRTLRKQAERRINTPLTSSCGRLFDAMSALLGVCSEASYEGQAAMLLEAAAGAARSYDAAAVRELAYRVDLQEKESAVVVPGLDILRAAWTDYRAGTSRDLVSFRFHVTIADMVRAVLLRLRSQSRLNRVCLSGGVFQNMLLLYLTVALLEREGFRVFFPRILPSNDGGISYGQAVAVAAQVAS